MTKEEAQTEEIKTETKTEAAPDSPTKSEGESKVEEGQASGDAAAEEGKSADEATKPAEGGKSSSTSTRKKKWLPWQRREGNSVKGASTTEPTSQDPAEERQPTEAEIDAELQKRINDLEQQKVKMQERLQLYRKINDLEKDVGEMRGEIDTLKVSVQRAEDGEIKVPDEGQ